MAHISPFRRHIVRLSLPLCLAGFAPVGALADDAPPAQVAVCLSCHGNGMAKPADPTTPIIAGQQYAYLLAALTAYQNGQRSSPPAQLMTTIAKGLSATDLDIAAGFFANLRAAQW